MAAHGFSSASNYPPSDSSEDVVERVGPFSMKPERQLSQDAFHNFALARFDQGNRLAIDFVVQGVVIETKLV